MTKRRDLNVVGGTVDVLVYNYSMLRVIINGIQEQLRLQAEYNGYIKSIQKGFVIVGDILNVLTGFVKLASTALALTLNDEKININTYGIEDFTFPGMRVPGDDWPRSKNPISGQFLFDMDTSAAGQVLK